MSKPSQPCPQTSSPNHSSIVLSLIRFFLILSILITLSEKSQHLRLCLLSDGATISKPYVEMGLTVSWPLLFSFWHSCSPTPPFLHFVPHPSCTLSITFHGWPQVFKLNRSPHLYSSNLQPSTCLTHILTQLFRLAFHRLSFLFPIVQC